MGVMHEADSIWNTWLCSVSWSDVSLLHKIVRKLNRIGRAIFPSIYRICHFNYILVICGFWAINSSPWHILTCVTCFGVMLSIVYDCLFYLGMLYFWRYWDSKKCYKAPHLPLSDKFCMVQELVKIHSPFIALISVSSRLSLSSSSFWSSLVISSSYESFNFISFGFLPHTSLSIFFALDLFLIRVFQFYFLWISSSYESFNFISFGSHPHW